MLQAFLVVMAGVPIRSLDGMLGSLLHLMFFEVGSLQEARGRLCGARYCVKVMARGMFMSRHAFMAFYRLAPVPTFDLAPCDCIVHMAPAVRRPGNRIALEAAAAILLHMVSYVWPAAMLQRRSLGDLRLYWAIVFFIGTETGRSMTFQQADTVEVGLLGGRGYMNDVLKALVVSAPAVGCLNSFEVLAYLRMVMAASVKAGLTAMNIIPHLFRHTGQSLDDLYIGDLRIVQKRGMTEAQVFGRPVQLA
jgi:hypothetical protein